MGSMTVFREKLQILYGRYEIYIRPAVKFLCALALFFEISRLTGGSSLLENPGVMLILSLLCMVISKNAILYVTAIYTALLLYPVSMEYCVVFAFSMLVILLLYMQFSPENAYLIGLSLLACGLHLGPVPAVLAGLFLGPVAMVPVACGTFLYYTLSGIAPYLAASQTEAGSMIDRFRIVIESVFYNKAMFLAVAASALAVLAVFLLRKLKIRYVWILSVIGGLLLDFLIRVAGALILKTQASFVSALISLVISLLICVVVLIFTRDFDYQRTEIVQFEDDDYYYYVKAIPKKHMPANRTPQGSVHRRRELHEEGK